ncbi:PAS domain S-box protein [Sunxiuqinia sp. sy24]|uniref:PAS domain S-box protein n=1 Tax=Sunxiuqinia sp. sy24 TaxID=3461495 RepID=UPI0040455136
MWKDTQELERRTKEEEIQQLKQQLEEQTLKNAMLEKQLHQYRKEQPKSTMLQTESEFEPTDFENLNALSVPAWEQDYSKAHKRIAKLKKQGITNLQDYFDQHPQEFFALIKQVRIINYNQAAANLRMDDREISTLSDLFHPSGYQCIIKKLETIQRQEKELVTEISVLKSNGEAAYYLMRWVSDENHSKNYSKVYVSLIDIAAQDLVENPLREANRKLSTLLGNLHGIVYQCRADASYTMLFLSKMVYSMTGYQADELLMNRDLAFIDLIHPEDLRHTEQQISLAIHHNERFTVEYRIRTKSGKEKWFWEQGVGVKNQAGEIDTIEGYILDITARKKAEKAQQESEEKFKQSFHFSNSLMLLSTADKNGRILEANYRFEEVTGWSKEEYLNHSTFDIGLWANPNERDEYLRELHRVGFVKNKEYDFRLKSGEVRNGLVSGQILQLQQGPAVLGMITDITEQKQAQLELYNESLHLQTVFETIPDLIWLKDPQGKYLNCNYQFEQFIGAKEKDIIGKTDYDFENKNQADWFKKNDLAAIQANQSKTNLEWVTFASDGHQALLETVKTPMFDSKEELVGVLGIARDVTKSKQNEKELKERKNWYKTIFNNTGTATCILNDNQEIVQMNDMFKQLSGFTQTDLDNKVKWMDFVSPEDLPRMLQYQKERGKPGKNPPRQYDCTLISKHGTHHHAMINIDRIPETNMSVASLLDITLRIKAIDELKQSQEKYQNLVESINDIIYELDEDWNFSYVSPSVEAITGYSPDFYLGKHFMTVVSPTNVSRMQQEFDLFLNAPDSVPFDFQPNTKHKQEVWLRISVHPKMEKGSMSGLRGIAIDITKQKATEAELIHAKEKAEQANNLKSAFLATMSHELRTPLNAIIGFSQLMDDSISKEDLLEMGKIIYNSGNHLLSIIESILDLTMLQSKQARVKAETFDFSDLLKDLRFFLNGELQKQENKKLCGVFPNLDESHKIELNTDRTKLTQLLTNLLSNAVKYSKEGAIEFGYQLTDETITFAVKDDGIGIPVDKQELIFERFRQLDDTSTRRYSGVGLGLAICKEIADLLNGKLWVESAVGKGATFYFELPLVASIQKDC